MEINFDDLIFFSETETDLFSPRVHAEDSQFDGVSGILLPGQPVEVLDTGGTDLIEHFIDPDPKAADPLSVNVICKPELPGTQSLALLDSSGLINQAIFVDSDTVTAEPSFEVNSENTGELDFIVKSEVPLDSIPCSTSDNSLTTMDLTLVCDRVFEDRKAVILFMDAFCKCNMTPQFVITNSSKQNGFYLT